MSALRTALRATAGGGGRLVLLLGEGGIGKTYLAGAAAAWAAEQGFAVHWVQCRAGVRAPLGPWRQIVRGCCGAANALGDHADGHMCRSPLQACPSRCDAVLDEGDLTRSADRLQNVLAAAGVARPLLMILEDFHHSDAPSLELLEAVADTLASLPVCLIVTARDCRPADPLRAARLSRLSCLVWADTLWLRAFDTDDVGAYLKLLRRTPADTPPARALHERTDGLPLFVAEFAAAGCARDGDGGKNDDPVPERVAYAVEEQLAALSPATRAVLAAAAVIGRTFGLPALAELLERELRDVAPALDQAVAQRILCVLRDDTERFDFRHAVVHEILSASAAPSLRRHWQVLRQGSASQRGARPGRAANVFRRDGEFWTVAYAGETVRLKDCRGLRYLGQLIQHQGRALHVLELVATVNGLDVTHLPQVVRALDSPLAVLDSQARENYRRRLRDLASDLEEADRCNDLGRVERLRAESEALTAQLAEAFRRPGRSAIGASETERARINVRTTLTNTLNRILKHQPALCEHLRNALKTGTLCLYDPDPMQIWDL
ncbi:MAG: AAA family ATPase [Deltaproteobacteria bacterium]|nr:AAA family ATPase [Deltaproteobacteria bacterium]